MYIYMCRVANLPDSLSTHMSNVHMGMVSANEFYEVDTASGIMSRRIRSPKSLKPQLVIMTDDLYRVYHKGIYTTDFSYEIGDQGRNFRAKVTYFISLSLSVSLFQMCYMNINMLPLDVYMCVQVILLFWTGDYPALALVSGTHSKTCHWCHYMSAHAPEVSRRCWGDYRCFLPGQHPFRRNANYGPVENGPPPATRTQEDFIRDGLASEAYRGPKSRAPYKTSGVKELSAFGALPMFDLVWDVLPDMMHIISGIWKRHIFEMLIGNRTPAKPKPRSSWTASANANLAADYTDVMDKLNAWKLSPDMVKVYTHAHCGFYYICVLYVCI
jgi:hypothetical protein